MCSPMWGVANVDTATVDATHCVPKVCVLTMELVSLEGRLFLLSHYCMQICNTTFVSCNMCVTTGSVSSGVVKVD